jgi:uncharacterized protein YbjT (DUF2867 family)
MNVLVAGGSGFVGRHLVPELRRRGHDISVMTRHPERQAPDAGAVFGDVDDPSSLAQPFDGIDTAFFLVHSLDRADFAVRDAAGAHAFVEQAAASGVRRIVYLGGLGNDDDTLSPHLRSRREVEEILSAGAPTVALRAGIVVGDGSVSWEILCQLIERLPVMITPRWVNTRTQPIALADVVAYLAAAMDECVVPDHYEVGAPEAMSYRDMLRVAAKEMGRRLYILPVPVLSPRLSSHWLQLITDVDVRTARSLVDSMTNEVVVTERRLERLSHHAPMPFTMAAREALGDRRRRRADTDTDRVNR